MSELFDYKKRLALMTDCELDEEIEWWADRPGSLPQERRDAIEREIDLRLATRNE